MNDIFRLDRARGALFDARGRRFDPREREWVHADTQPPQHAVDLLEAAAWLQRESGHPLRIPVGVIGPRDATDGQRAAARAAGTHLAQCGFAVICGGRQGVMEAACEGSAQAGGLSIGLLPEPDPTQANPYVGIVIATGIGEARNALIARAAFCLIAIGDSFGTLSEVALGRQFGKVVFGLEGAARVEGVRHVADARAAVMGVAALALALDPEV